jgi:hypothetical protein
MTTSRSLPSKKDVALALLQMADVYIHLDPRREHVVVPPWLANKAPLILQVGLNMPVPIPDLDVDDECISCTLSFNRSPFWCRLPWPSIYALVSAGEERRGMVWPEDVPAELADQFQRAKAQEAAAERASVEPLAQPRRAAGRRKKGNARAPARAGDDGEDRVEPQAQPPPPPRPVPVAVPARAGAQPKRKRELPPYLRVVK